MNLELSKTTVLIIARFRTEMHHREFPVLQLLKHPAVVDKSNSRDQEIDHNVHVATCNKEQRRVCDVKLHALTLCLSCGYIYIDSRHATPLLKTLFIVGMTGV